MAPSEIAADHFSADIGEFIRLLSKHDVLYLIVGGEAVIYYGHVRLTGDVDFFYGLAESNLKVLFEALLEFWDGDIPGLKGYEDLSNPGQIIQFGIPPNRIDLITEIDGVDFEDAWPHRVVTNLVSESSRIPIQFIGLNHLIQNKRASGRPQDLDDLRFLEKK